MAPAPSRLEQLEMLRAQVADCERAADLAAVVDKLRELAGRAFGDDELYDRVATAIIAAERKGGKLLAVDAEGVGKFKRRRWSEVARLTDAEFVQEVERYKEMARQRRECQAGTAAEKMATSLWYRDRLGIAVRFRFGHGVDEDPLKIEQALVNESGGLRAVERAA